MIHWKLIRRTKLFAVLISVLLLTSLGCGEEESRFEDNGLCLVEVEGVFQEIELDEMPKYLGGDFSDFYSEMYLILKYPFEARENGIEGICILNYEISEEGIIENIVAIQDPGGGIGAASVDALTTVAEGVVLTPGILNDVPVRVKKELEIKFKLEG